MFVKQTLACVFGVLILGVAPPSRASLDLAKSKNCTACHAVDKKLIGPAFKDIAAKYGNDKSATVRLTKKVQTGGVGVWGQIPMPANPQVNEAEAASLVKWVLSIQ